VLKSLVPVTSSPTEPSWVADPGFSASDCRAYLILRNEGGTIAAVEFGDVVSITLSSHRDKFPVARMGEINPIGFVGGHRTVAGGIVVLFHSESDLRNAVRAASQVLISGSEAQVWLRQWDVSPYVKPDELPPVDLLLVFISETGTASAILLRGIAFLDEGMSIQVDQPEPIISMSFLAVDYEIRHPDEIARSKKARQEAAAQPEQVFPPELPVTEHSVVSFSPANVVAGPEVVYGPPSPPPNVRSAGGPAAYKAYSTPPQPGLNASIPYSSLLSMVTTPVESSSEPTSVTSGLLGRPVQIRPSQSSLPLGHLDELRGSHTVIQQVPSQPISLQPKPSRPVPQNTDTFRLFIDIMDTVGRYLGGRAYDMVRSGLGDVGKSIRYWYNNVVGSSAPAPSSVQSTGTGSPPPPGIGYPTRYRSVGPAPETLGELIQAPLRIPLWNALRGLGTGNIVPYSRPSRLPEGVEASKFKNVQILPYNRQSNRR